MADDKSKHDFRGRDRVSAEEDYVVAHFAQQNGITSQQVRDLIGKYGNSRQADRGCQEAERCPSWAN